MLEIIAVSIIVIGAAAYGVFYLRREWRSAQTKKACGKKFTGNFASADCSQCSASGCAYRHAPSLRAEKTMDQYRIPRKP